MNLEHEIKGKNEKILIHKIHDFLEKHNLDNLMHEFNHIVKIIKKGMSRFEWVDSILIKAIVQGEWVVFENANLCNPSILDRLNPLLEEGNNSLCINE